MPAEATPADQAQLDAMLARVDSGVLPDPQELAWMRGDDPRLGATVMRGSNWHATMRLR